MRLLRLSGFLLIALTLTGLAGAHGGAPYVSKASVIATLKNQYGADKAICQGAGADFRLKAGLKLRRHWNCAMTRPGRQTVCFTYHAGAAEGYVLGDLRACGSQPATSATTGVDCAALNRLFALQNLQAIASGNYEPTASLNSLVQQTALKRALGC